MASRRIRTVPQSNRKEPKQTGLALSLLLHGAVLGVLIFAFTAEPLKPPVDNAAFVMEFSGVSATSMKALTENKVPAPTDQQKNTQGLIAQKPPLPQKTVLSTTPPPPPPPAAASSPAPVAPQKVAPPVLPVVRPIAKAPVKQPTEAKIITAPQSPVKIPKIKPHPKAAPQPHVVKETAPAPAVPHIEKIKAPPHTSPIRHEEPKSLSHQPKMPYHPTPLSQSVLNTLMKLKALEQEKSPPKVLINPAKGGAVNGGGTEAGTSTTALSLSQRMSVGAWVRRCWTLPESTAPMSVLLSVVTDATGTVREASVAPEDMARYNTNPVFAAFANRAVDAVLNYQCAKLPLPPSMLGSIHHFEFRFTP